MDNKYVIIFSAIVIFILGLVLGANKFGTGLLIVAKYKDVELNIIGDKYKLIEKMLSEKDQSQSDMIASIIKRLDPDHPLSDELIKQSKNTEGPWHSVEKNVKVFIEDSKEIDSFKSIDYAVTCGNSTFSKQPILIYSRDTESSTKRAYPVVVLQDVSKPDICKKGDEVIWISTKTAKRWLDIEKINEHEMNIYGKIISPDLLIDQP